MALQIGNYVFPLILLPYLIRVLGLEVFGTWMFALSFVIIARTCVSYGFDLTATRQVAIHRCQPVVLSELYEAVVVIRFTIWSLSLVALLLAATVADELRPLTALLAAGMLILLGEILFPVWLFQGAETMALITQVKLAAKTVNLLLVLMLVKGPADVVLVPLLEAATSMVAGAVAMFVGVRRFSLRWVPLSARRVGGEVRDGAPLFLAHASVHAYTSINFIVLGFLLGPVAVAQYSIAEKIYSAIRGLLSPIVQALFPAMAAKYENSRRDFRVETIRLTTTLGFLLIVAALAVISMADLLIFLIAGERSDAAAMILRILGAALIFALGSFLGPMLVAQGRNRALLRITIVGAIAGLVTIMPLVSLLGVAGAAISFLLVQIYNTIALVTASIGREEIARQPF